MDKKLMLITIAMTLCVFSTVVFAYDAGEPPTEVLNKLYPGKAYSPYVKRNFPTHIYWGDSHLHTGLSLDAGLFGNTLGPDEAWRFARGEEVRSSTGLPVKLARPLDWMVLADHSDLMGIAPDIQNGAPAILKNAKGKEWHEGFKQGGEAAGKAAFDLIMNFSQSRENSQLSSVLNGPLFQRVSTCIVT
jgi:hypothetical protein